jgi:hypothetical protein
MPAMNHPFAPLVLLICAGALLEVGCGDDSDDSPSSTSTSASASGGATTSGGGSGAGTTTGGGGGAQPDCINHADCTDGAAAQCDGGSCVPCGESTHCEGVVGAGVCSAGSCVECLLGEEEACVGGKTCDLLASACVDVAPTSLGNCDACTNDVQCAGGHRCIAMDFESQPHGFYCLEEAMPTCNQPFISSINKVSISGAPAVNYCGIVEGLATCEAVTALLEDWRCSGTDGMCSPDGVLPEQPVPGAICRQVGALADRCSYACSGTQECLVTPSASTCGTGAQAPPGWCGG